jgi:pyruvate formate lyase activating enzyme
MHRAFQSVTGWLRQSFIDYPGKIATVLFFSGCNLRCPFCHNPDLALSRTDTIINADEFFAFLDKRKNLLEGVVLSGGEPTLWPAELADLIPAIRKTGLTVKLDTNGMLPEVVCVNMPDYLALDIKASPAAYKILFAAPFTDVPERLEKSLAIVRSMGARAEVRITCVPGIINEEVIREISPLLKGVMRVFLQPFKNSVPLLDPAFKKKLSIPKETMQHFAEILKGYVGECRIRGA